MNAFPDSVYDNDDDDYKSVEYDIEPDDSSDDVKSDVESDDSESCLFYVNCQSDENCKENVEPKKETVEMLEETNVVQPTNTLAEQTTPQSPTESSTPRIKLNTQYLDTLPEQQRIEIKERLIELRVLFVDEEEKKVCANAAEKVKKVRAARQKACDEFMKDVKFRMYSLSTKAFGWIVDHHPCQTGNETLDISLDVNTLSELECFSMRELAKKRMDELKKQLTDIPVQVGMHKAFRARLNERLAVLRNEDDDERGI